jgi:hypothetical protein
MPYAKKRPYDIPADVKLFCPECQIVSKVVLKDTSNSFDAALLECGHSRSAYVPPSGTGLEDLATEEGRTAFPAEMEYQRQQQQHQCA